MRDGGWIGWVGAVALLYGTVAMIGTSHGVPLAHLTKDPMAVLEGPVYTGAFSHLGLFLWVAAATLCFFAAASRGALKRFFLASGCLTTLLLIDDLFLLHELVLPEGLGIKQKLVYAGWGLLGAAYLIVHARTILSLRPAPLVAAFTCFAMSIGFDVVADRWHLQHALWNGAEDGLKLLGITCWAAFFWRASREAIAMQPAEAEKKPARQASPVGAHWNRSKSSGPAPQSGIGQRSGGTSPSSM